MRCRGWRYLQIDNRWSRLHPCFTRWHPDNFRLTWRQVWGDE